MQKNKWLNLFLYELPEKKLIIYVLAAAFLLRIAIALVYQWYVDTQGGGISFMSDESHYLALGWYQALLFKLKDLSHLPQKYYAVIDPHVKEIFEGWIAFRGNKGLIANLPSEFYGIVLGYIFFIFGYSVLLARFFSILIGLLIILAVYFIAGLTFGKTPARLSFIFFAFLPAQIFFSISILRDIMLEFLTVFALLLFYKIKDMKNLMIFIAPLLLTLFVCRYFGADFTRMLLSVLCVAALIKILDFKKRRIFSFVVSAAIIGAVFNSQVSTNLSDYLKHRYLSLINRHISKSQQPCQTGYKILPAKLYSSKYANDKDKKIEEILASKREITIDEITVSSYEDKPVENINEQKMYNREKFIINRDLLLGDINMFTYYLKGLFYVLFAPFPWHIKKLTHVFASIQMIIFYALFPFMCAGLLDVVRKPAKNKFILVAFFFIFISVILFGEGTVGELVRHREVISFAYVIFAAAGIANIFFKNKEKDKKDILINAIQ